MPRRPPVPRGRSSLPAARVADTAALEILVDSNEAIPQHRGYRFDGDRVLSLDCADYSALALIDCLRIERKSLADFVGTCGAGRERFTRTTLEPMTAYAHRYLLLEFSLPQLAAGGWRPQVTPASAVGSLFAWTARYGVVPLFAGDPVHARAAVIRIVEHTLKVKVQLEHVVEGFAAIGRGESVDLDDWIAEMEKQKDGDMTS